MLQTKYRDAKHREAFLAVAREIKLKGLSGEEEEEGVENNESPTNKQTNKTEKRADKLHDGTR